MIYWPILQSDDFPQDDIGESRDAYAAASACVDATFDSAFDSDRRENVVIWVV